MGPDSRSDAIFEISDPKNCFDVLFSKVGGTFELLPWGGQTVSVKIEGQLKILDQSFVEFRSDFAFIRYSDGPILWYTLCMRG